ncbi:MAG: tetratricopeptide repeat protein [Myxococcota bacterium]
MPDQIRHLEIGTLDLNTGVVERQDGSTVSLTHLEIKFVRHLAQADEQVIPTPALLHEVWGYSPKVDTRAPTKLAYRLRKKLEKDPSEPRHLLRYQGAGFLLRFAPPPPLQPQQSPHRQPHRMFGVFFGRDRELAQLDALVERAGVVTLLGPGGVGKTTLAKQLLPHTGERFPGGVTFIDLLNCTTTDAVVHHVSQSVGVAHASASEQTLRAALARRGRALWILDNLEHIVDIARPLIDEWRRDAPEAVWLLTSRVPLKVEGEQLLHLSGLSLDAARSLFWSSVRRNRPDHQLSEGDDRRLDELIRQLDGLPLAIEMAAGRAHLLSLSALLAQLDRRFVLLRSRRTDRPARHRTLRATLEWSWALLDDEERRALMVAAVFGAPFTLEAAEQIFPPSESWALDLLSSLIEKSLLSCAEVRSNDFRFHLPTSVRAFAAEKLGLDPVLDRRSLQAAIGAWYGATFHAMEETLSDAVRLDHIRHDLGNLLIGAYSDDDIGAIGCTFPLLEWFQLQGPISQAHDLIRHSLQRDALAATQRAELWAYQSSMHRLQGDLERASEASAQAMAAIRHEPPSSLRAGIEIVAANLEIKRQRWETARALLQTARQTASAAGDPLKEGLALSSMGYLEQRRGAFTAAADHFHGAFDCFQRSGNRRGEGVSLSQLVSLYWIRGDHDRAEHTAHRALAIHQDVSDQRFEAITRQNLGRALRDAGRLADAEAQLTRALALQHEIGTLDEQLFVFNDLGQLRIAQGDLDGGRAALRDAIQIVARNPRPGASGLTKLSMGLLEYTDGNLADAERYFEEAEALLHESDRRYELGILWSHWGRLMAAREQLDPARALLRRAQGVVDTFDVLPTSPLCAAVASLSAALRAAQSTSPSM